MADTSVAQNMLPESYLCMILQLNHTGNVERSSLHSQRGYLLINPLEVEKYDHEGKCI